MVPEGKLSKGYKGSFCIVSYAEIILKFIKILRQIKEEYEGSNQEFWKRNFFLSVRSMCDYSSPLASTSEGGSELVQRILKK